MNCQYFFFMQPIHTIKENVEILYRRSLSVLFKFTVCNTIKTGINLFNYKHNFFNVKGSQVFSLIITFINKHLGTNVFKKNVYPNKLLNSFFFYYYVLQILYSYCISNARSSVYIYFLNKNNITVPILYHINLNMFSDYVIAYLLILGL